MTTESTVAPVAPTLNITTVTADRPDPAAPETKPTSDGGGDAESDAATTPDGEAKPPKTAEQKELEYLRRKLTRAERNNARLWAESQQRQSPQAQRQATDAGGEEQGAADDRVEVTREAFESAAQERARILRAQESLVDQCNNFLDQGKKKDAEFDKKLVAVGEEISFFDGRGMPTPALHVLLGADQPIEIIRHLADNPEVAAQLADLNPLQLTRRLTKLESELSQKPVREVSTAPRPLTPERAASSPAEPNPDKDPEGWREWRNKTAKRR